MKFRPLPLPGAYLIEPQPIADNRGFFGRVFCAEEFARHGLETAVSQCNISFNARSGTLRGMHFQIAPHEEVKVVRCTSGAIYDVILDLRPDSPTFLHWHAVELTADNRHLLYVPAGLAHGFQTLADGTEVFYQMSTPYAPEHAKGVRFDDPSAGIEWPLPVSVISDRDLAYPLLEGASP